MENSLPVHKKALADPGFFNKRFIISERRKGEGGGGGGRGGRVQHDQTTVLTLSVCRDLSKQTV